MAIFGGLLKNLNPYILPFGAGEKMTTLVTAFM
jgi:hypothetical protein